MFNPRRELGRTGFKATALGIGDVADRALPISQCVATVQRALDAGLNVIDTAPGYESGYSEQIVGKALQGRRDGVFVINKIDHLDQPVGRQVDASLQNMDLDMVDLFVFHGVTEKNHWKKIMSPGGGMDQLGECVAAGKVRYRGVSAHHPDVVRAAILSGVCDVVMFGVGPFCDSRYVEKLLPLAREHRVGTVCFKTFGSGKLLGDTTGYGQPLEGRSGLPRLTVAECVHYTLTCDPDVALLGLSMPGEQDAAFASAANFRPLTQQQMVEVRQHAAEAVKGKGPCWWNPNP